MMAAQIIAAHGGAMACYRCAAEASEGQARRDDLAVADRLARTFALLVATLHRYRGKARQTITVEYVHVREDAPALAAPERAAPAGRAGGAGGAGGAAKKSKITPCSRRRRARARRPEGRDEKVGN